MQIPIACTLTSDDAANRVEEWRVVLGSTVTRSSRPAPARAELRLINEAGAIATLIQLAQQEKACCEFFGFAFEVDVDGVTLVVSVPDDAVAVLDSFAALAQSAPADQF